MCPGTAKSFLLELGSIIFFIVTALSAAEIPVVVPSTASTVMVNCVPCKAEFSSTIKGSSSSSRRLPVREMQTNPLP